MYFFLGSLACFGLVCSLTTMKANHCRCRPWEKCWPSDAQWTALNESIQGKLLRLRPVASVCHGTEYDATACANLSSLIVDSGWLASNPRTLQDWVWESGNTAEDTCFYITSPEYNRQSECRQGRIPLYSAVVESVADIQACVRFASRHDVRLVVRNTGHDSVGRSASPHSFQIHTGLLKKMSLHENFVPRGSSTGRGPAVTLGAGVLLWEAYAHGVENGYTIVGGECPTVGAVGGFLQGGGVAIANSFVRGLAVDNVLEYQVVTSDAKHMTANEYENADLFWALRGGGGGTFGIVTQATVRVFPDRPVTVTLTTIRTAVTNALFWTEGVPELFRLVRHFNHVQRPSRILIKRPTADSIQAKLQVYFENMTDEAHATDVLGSTLRPLARYNISTSTSAEAQKGLIPARLLKPDIGANQLGVLDASVLISAARIQSREARRRTADTFRQLDLGPNDMIYTSNLGGRVAENAAIDIPLHPAWRKAAHLVTLVRELEPTMQAKLSGLESLTSRDFPLLYSIEPDFRVSYRNLGDPREKEFQATYWGAHHYARLAAIKAKWDPMELFISRKGVGSEDWDDEGMCKRKKRHRAL